MVYLQGHNLFVRLYMEEKPLISVIMPVYNVEHYVGRAIESIQNQNFSSYEIICVDDCSTDSSYSVLESYASKDPKIKLYRNDFNIGAGASKNNALSLAQGEYVCFCDADDYFSQGMFETLHHYISKSNADGIMYGSNYWIGDKCSRCRFIDGLDVKMYYPYQMLEAHIMEKAFFTSACRMVVRLSYLRNRGIRFSEGSLCDDLEYTLGLMLSKEGKFIYLKESFYNYCKRDGSISSNILSGIFLCNVLDSIFYYVRTKGDIPSKLRELLYGILANLYVALNWDERNIFLRHINTNYSDRLMDEILSVRCSRFFYKIDEVITAVQQHSANIYIYGAGNYAVDLYRVLKAYGICVSGFVVSSLDGNVASIDDVKVFNIDDVACKICDSLILVATLPRHHDKILQTLTCLEITNIVLCK